MAGSVGADTVVDSSHFTATNSIRGLVFSMTVSGDTTPGNPLTGHVNAIDIYDLTGHIQVTSNGWNFLASDLNNALQTYASNHSLTSELDTIFGAVSYSAVGNFEPNNQFNNSSVNFGGDTFVSGMATTSSTVSQTRMEISTTATPWTIPTCPQAPVILA